MDEPGAGGVGRGPAEYRGFLGVRDAHQGAERLVGEQVQEVEEGRLSEKGVVGLGIGGEKPLELLRALRPVGPGLAPRVLRALVVLLYPVHQVLGHRDRRRRPVCARGFGPGGEEGGAQVAADERAEGVLGRLEDLAHEEHLGSLGRRDRLGRRAARGRRHARARPGHQGAVHQAFDLAGGLGGEPADDAAEDLLLRRLEGLPSRILGQGRVEKDVDLRVRRRDGCLDLEHLGEIVDALFRLEAEIFVMLLHQVLDDLAVDADDEDEPRDVQIELERFEDLEADFGHAAVEIVDEDDHALVPAERLCDPGFERALEGVEVGALRVHEFLRVLLNLLQALEVEVGLRGTGKADREFDARYEVDEGVAEKGPEIPGRFHIALGVRVRRLQAGDDHLRHQAAPYVLLGLILPGIEPNGVNRDLAIRRSLLVPDPQASIEPLHGRGLARAPVPVDGGGHRRARLGVAQDVVDGADVQAEVEAVGPRRFLRKRMIRRDRQPGGLEERIVVVGVIGHVRTQPARAKLWSKGRILPEILPEIPRILQITRR